MDSPRDVFFDMIVDDMIPKDELASMLTKWMTNEDIKDMLEANELWPESPDEEDLDWLDHELEGQSLSLASILEKGKNRNLF